LLSGKLHLKYDGKDLEAMKAIAVAAQKRSLAAFNLARTEFNKELEGDKVIRSHLDTVYDKMMEQNLCRIIEPYSKVQVIWQSHKFSVSNLLHYTTNVTNNVVSLINFWVVLCQISHVAAQIGLPEKNVETKLSQMILDRKLAGVLDQGAGLLVIFEQMEDSKAYEAALGLIQNMGKVVDALYHKAKHLT